MFQIILLISTTLVASQTNRICTTNGLFPIRHTICKKFYQCHFADDKFYYVEKQCEDTANIFDPRQQKCVKDYICLDFICQGKYESGFKFLDLNNKQLTTYISCEEDQRGYYYPKVGYCPENEKFEVFHPAVLIGKCTPIK